MRQSGNADQNSPKPRSPDAEISFSDLSSFFRHNAALVLTEGSMHALDTSVTLGDVTSSQGDRERFGPVIIDYVEDASPHELYGGQKVDERAIIKSALARLYAAREKDSRGFRDVRAELIREARSHVNEFPFVATAVETVNALQGYEAEVIAQDVLAASGYVIRMSRQEAVDAPIELARYGQPPGDDPVTEDITDLKDAV